MSTPPETSDRDCGAPEQLTCRKGCSKTFQSEASRLVHEKGPLHVEKIRHSTRLTAKRPAINQRHHSGNPKRMCSTVDEVATDEDSDIGSSLSTDDAPQHSPAILLPQRGSQSQTPVLKLERVAFYKRHYSNNCGPKRSPTFHRSRFDPLASTSPAQSSISANRETDTKSPPELPTVAIAPRSAGQNAMRPSLLKSQLATAARSSSAPVSTPIPYAATRRIICPPPMTDPAQLPNPGNPSASIDDLRVRAVPSATYRALITSALKPDADSSFCGACFVAGLPYSNHIDEECTEPAAAKCLAARTATGSIGLARLLEVRFDVDAHLCWGCWSFMHRNQKRKGSGAGRFNDVYRPILHAAYAQRRLEPLAALKFDPTTEFDEY
ncbi:hypothetical protein BKA62DRAFT_675986 [Auriculariales sp. MPI-PUGE-AT-0066]|nr:hypothetical protein BKA62DRAFT_675986 [Auriculariales sp. MPI-PUGE-AT-0066]